MKKLFLVLLFLLSITTVQAAVVTHGGTLPDSSQKSDFYALIDSATVTGIVNADVSSSAAIAASKLDLSSPGTIGGTAAGAANFTTIKTTGNVGINTGVPTGAALMVSGNVGIGSVNPIQALDVNGTLRGTSFIQTGSIANNFTGNVGINSANPGQNLDINGTVRALGFQGIVGSTSTPSFGSNIQATTDLFVEGYACNSSTTTLTITCKTDSSATPTTTVLSAQENNLANTCLPFGFLVKKNNYYNVTLSNASSSSISSVVIGS